MCIVKVDYSCSLVGVGNFSGDASTSPTKRDKCHVIVSPPARLRAVDRGSDKPLTPPCRSGRRSELGAQYFVFLYLTAFVDGARNTGTKVETPPY